VAISAVAVGFTAVAPSCGAPASAGLLEGAEAGWLALAVDGGASVAVAFDGDVSGVVAFDGDVSGFVAAGGSVFLALVVHPGTARIANTKQPNTLCRSFIPTSILHYAV
jgi:hypothetical protein